MGKSAANSGNFWHSQRNGLGSVTRESLNSNNSNLEYFEQSNFYGFYWFLFFFFLSAWPEPEKDAKDDSSVSFVALIGPFLIKFRVFPSQS